MDATKERVIDILFHSFYDNKSVNFVIKQDAKKNKRLRTLLEYSHFMGENFGKVILTEDQKACAILLDTRKKKTTLKAIIWDIKLAARCIGIGNLKKVMKRESAIKKAHPSGDFIHLWYIGVEPNNQGNGLGTNLMNEIIQEARSEGLPVYLETSNERNFPFYERLGFEKFSDLSNLGYPLRMYLLN